MVVMTLHIVLRSLILAHLVCLAAPIPTGDRRDLPTNANGSRERARVEPR
jgi:hypothetical protein